jgi:hypothetical protein
MSYVSVNRPYQADNNKQTITKRLKNWWTYLAPLQRSEEISAEKESYVMDYTVTSPARNALTNA